MFIYTQRQPVRTHKQTPTPERERADCQNGDKKIQCRRRWLENKQQITRWQHLARGLHSRLKFHSAIKFRPRCATGDGKMVLYMFQCIQDKIII
jgi:hypothetical protein